MPAARPRPKGIELEENLRAYFWHSGYFVARGLPFQIDGEDVTDIDLWLYERPAAVSRRRLVVDVKNKRSPKAAERVVWVRGLVAALGVDGAIVATTDNRPGIRRLGKALGIQILDGHAVTKISQSDRIRNWDQASLEEFDAAVREVDSKRRSADWRNELQEARAAMVVAMGVPSANRSLSAAAFFAEQTIAAQPLSMQANVGLRLMYLTSAFAAISLDFVLADQAFRSADERRQILINAIRFGQPESVATLPSVKAALNLARKYAENGPAVAKQIEMGFSGEADRIPAELIADYLATISRSDMLFSAAREIEHASTSREVPGFDELSSEAKSVLGVFLDFNGINREKVALAWSATARRGNAKVRNEPELFDPPASAEATESKQASSSNPTEGSAAS
jgi:hypothetical protein